MSDFLKQFEAMSESDRWPMVRNWMRETPSALYAELRVNAPVLVTPEVTLVTRFDDCLEVLRRNDLFSIAPYKPKQGTYWMAQDDTAQHWREKSIMHAILDHEDIPVIRKYIGEKTAELLKNADGKIEAIRGITRAVPVALVQDWFGYDNSDPDDLIRWSYWNQMDAYWNQPFNDGAGIGREKITAEHEETGKQMSLYLAGLIANKTLTRQEVGGNDPVSRLLQLAASESLRFDAERVAINVGGLLIGAVESTSHAVVNALCYLMGDPERLDAARAAARGPFPESIDGFVFEALRLSPAYPYYFRTCESDTVLARGTELETAIPKGATVVAITHSAMLDPSAFQDPNNFDPTRSQSNSFHFGVGLHECLGRGIGSAMVPAIVREVLRLEDLEAGEVDRKGGPVPESWQWTWGRTTHHPQSQ